jgi:excisionase family DNA binding protein
MSHEHTPAADALPDVLTPEEAAAYLRIPVVTVRRALARGELPGALLARRWRVRRADLDALFGTQKRGATAAEPSGPVTVTTVPRAGRPGRPRKRRRSTR